MDDTYLVENIRKQQLKVSRFLECNDMFELGNFRNFRHRNRSDQKEVRRKINAWAKKQNDMWGLVCFTRSHESPLMWAHYGDRNAGACLEFELFAKKLPSQHKLLPVKYTKTRDIAKIQNVDRILKPICTDPATETLTTLCATKELDWNYEEEERLLVPLNRDNSQIRHDDAGNIFFNWPKLLELKNVWIGPKYKGCIPELQKALKSIEVATKIKWKRSAFNDFRMVRHKSKTLKCPCQKCNEGKSK